MLLPMTEYSLSTGAIISSIFDIFPVLILLVTIYIHISESVFTVFELLKVLYPIFSVMVLLETY